MTHSLNTRLVRTGEHVPSALGYTPTSMPIHASTTFFYPNLDALERAFEAGGEQVTYARAGNPTTNAFEALMADAEGGRGAVACGTGMSALYLALLSAGTPRGSQEPQPRHILASNDLYGSTHKLLNVFFGAQGVKITACDMTNLDEVRAKVDALEPDVILLESISNPLLKVADIGAIAAIGHAADARVIVDATMSTPVLCQPLALGADLVVHSATKYLSGHGDALGGVLVARGSLLSDTARQYGILLGTLLGPFEAKLIMRGIKTLSLRVRQQCESAQTIAETLALHHRVRRVFYPGLTSHPQHALAARQFEGRFGGMVSVELADCTRAAAAGFMNRLRLALSATSLGDIYTLATYPPVSSHRDVSAEARLAQGITDGLVRFSIGIEDVGDILDDILQALG